MAVECVIKNAPKTVGEGPHWDDMTNTLLYVDHQENAIHRFNPETSVGDKIILGTMGPYDPDVENMPKIGSLYCLDLDGSLHTMVKDVGISNGLAWTSDEKTMYYIDSTPRKIYRYDYDVTTGQISNQKVIVDNAGKPLPDFGFPDGMTIDTEGKLWVACFVASKVVQYDPQTGKQLQAVNIPALGITSCCFGGKNLDELYVTCSAHEFSKEEFEKYPMTGSVFRVKGLGVKGFKAQIYEGEIKEG